MDNNVESTEEIAMFYNKFMGNNHIEELKEQEEYKNSYNQKDEIFERIKNNLPESKKYLIFEYDSILTAISAEENKFCYINGFKKSVKLIKEIMKEEKRGH